MASVPPEQPLPGPFTPGTAKPAASRSPASVPCCSAPLAAPAL